MLHAGGDNAHCCNKQRFDLVVVVGCCCDNVLFYGTNVISIGTSNSVASLLMQASCFCNALFGFWPTSSMPVVTCCVKRALCTSAFTKSVRALTPAHLLRRRATRWRNRCIIERAGRRVRTRRRVISSNFPEELSVLRQRRRPQERGSLAGAVDH